MVGVIQTDPDDFADTANAGADARFALDEGQAIGIDEGYIAYGVL
jgi:hypothetical protein